MAASSIGLLWGIGLVISAGMGDRPRERVVRAQPIPAYVVTTAPADEIVSTAPADEVVISPVPCPHRCRKCRKVEAEIEKLRAENPPCAPEVCISYKVEIEDACPDQCFDLVLRVRHRKNVLLEAVIPLDQPTEVDDDELEFEGSFATRLGVVVMEDRKHLKIEGRIIDRGTGRTMDRESERIKDADEPIVVIEEEAVIHEGPMY